MGDGTRRERDASWADLPYLFHATDGKVMCFLETGGHKATYIVFDYDNPPKPPKPSVVWHAAKWAFNRAYRSLVPTGRV